LLDYITGKTDKSPRKLFFYFSDDGDVIAVRWDNWKIVFLEQRKPGTLGVWLEPFTKLRGPKMYNLRTDPYEFADITSNTYFDWTLHRSFLVIPVLAGVQKFMSTFKEFPPAQHPDSFTIEQAHDKMQSAAAGG